MFSNVRSDRQDPEAVMIVNKLDNANREMYLFKLLEASNDSIRLSVVECLNCVPLNNLQGEEVTFLIDMLAKIDNLTVGKTEQVKLEHSGCFSLSI